MPTTLFFRKCSGFSYLCFKHGSPWLASIRHFCKAGLTHSNWILGNEDHMIHDKERKLWFKRFIQYHTGTLVEMGTESSAPGQHSNKIILSLSAIPSSFILLNFCKKYIRVPSFFIQPRLFHRAGLFYEEGVSWKKKIVCDCVIKDYAIMHIYWIKAARLL